MEIQTKDISYSLALAIIGTSISVCFQIGYFLAVGFHFISFVGIADWLFTAGALFWFVAVGGLMLAMIFDFGRALGLGKFVSADSLMWAAKVIVFLSILAFFVANITHSTFANTIYQVAIGVSLVCLVSSLVGITLAFKEVLSKRSSIPVAGIALTAVYLNILIFCAGYLYGSYHGETCSITVAQGQATEAKLLRTVTDGYLLRRGEQVVFVPKSELKEIACAAPRPTSPKAT